MTSFVLDTSVLINSPKAVMTFEEHTVILPLAVLTELEKKRNDPQVGEQARSALRLLDHLSRTRPGNLRSGIKVNDIGGILRVEMNHVSTSSLPNTLTKNPSTDIRILAVAAGLMDDTDAKESEEVVLVSQDLPLRLLAETAGVKSEPYYHDQARREYSGIENLSITSEQRGHLHKRGVLEVGDQGITNNSGVVLSGSMGESGIGSIDTVLHRDSDAAPSRFDAGRQDGPVQIRYRRKILGKVGRQAQYRGKRDAEHQHAAGQRQPGSGAKQIGDVAPPPAPQGQPAEQRHEIDGQRPCLHPVGGRELNHDVEAG